MEDSLLPNDIADSLGTRFIGRRVSYYPSLASTMDMARREAKCGADEGTVIIAGRQTGGRGRLGRRWLAPEGNVALSVILYPDIACLPYLIMVASLAVVCTVEAVTGLSPGIKWPNDVLVADKKVSGILVESDVRRKKVNYAIVGIGINVNLKASDCPEIARTATSLSDEVGRELSPRDVVRRLLVEMERLYLALPEWRPIHQEWRRRLVTLGKPVRISSGGDACEGIAEDITATGNLLLRCGDGRLAEIVAGDVTTLPD